MTVQCSVYIATSVDGFIARPDGGIDWLQTVSRPGEDYGFAEFFASVDALVMGRKTYETALAFEPWPYAGKRCVVLTHGAPAPAHGEEFFAGQPAALVARLEREGAARVYVDGGAVIRQFLAAGLVTDVTLSVIPVLLGAGVPLFGGTGADIALELVSSRGYASGLVQLAYRVGRTPRMSAR